MLMNGVDFGWETPAAMFLALLPPSETLFVLGIGIFILYWFIHVPHLTGIDGGVKPCRANIYILEPLGIWITYYFRNMDRGLYLGKWSILPAFRVIWGLATFPNMDRSIVQIRGRHGNFLVVNSRWFIFGKVVTKKAFRCMATLQVKSSLLHLVYYQRCIILLCFVLFIS